jgi:hypothetical protein
MLRISKMQKRLAVTRKLGLGNGESCCGDGTIGQLKWTISSSGRVLVDNLALSIIPEPSTFALMLGGLFLLGTARRA